eukprot:scaffold7949_cov80-Cylindrotheca_fusiformis.AAC.1
MPSCSDKQLTQSTSDKFNDVEDGSSKNPIGETLKPSMMNWNNTIHFLAQKPQVVVLNKIDIPEVKESKDESSDGTITAAAEIYQGKAGLDYDSDDYEIVSGPSYPGQWRIRG